MLHITQVLRINEEVFLSVADRFSELCLMLLPSLKINLVKTKECASQGLAVTIKHSKDEGRFGLEQLSGGQRSLVSLSLLVAAAQEGSHSSALLLDEIDAALDEVTLPHGPAKPGTPSLCFNSVSCSNQCSMLLTMKVPPPPLRSTRALWPACSVPSPMTMELRLFASVTTRPFRQSVMAPLTLQGQGTQGAAWSVLIIRLQDAKSRMREWIAMVNQETRLLARGRQLKKGSVHYVEAQSELVHLTSTTLG